jgi:hypothetical protein
MKITKVLAIASILSLGAVGSAFAALGGTTSFTDTGTVTTGTPTMGLKPSKNVTVQYTSSATAVATGCATYSVSASHSSGTKSFASSSGDTKVFMKDGTALAPPTAPGVGSSADFSSSWTAM